MIEVSPRLVFLVGTIAAIFGLMYWDRKNVERSGILFFRRTKKGIEIIDRIAKKFPRFWNAYAWGGVIAAFASILLISLTVGGSIFNVAVTGNPSSNFGLVAPGTGSTVSTQPGVTFVPAEYWFISIVVLMVVHELSHGIVARLEDFDINSVGVLVLGVIPGAFVEPKGQNMLGGAEEVEGESHGAWDQGDWISRIKVLSAGSWANYVFAAVFLGLWILSGSMLASPGEIHYTAQKGYPAAEAGMDSGRLIAFNGSEINNISEFNSSASKIKVNETYSLKTTEGEFKVEATSINGDEKGYLGVRFSIYSGLERWFLSLLQIISFLNLGIGLFNMLPAKPLDGGHILDAVVERFAGEEYRKYVNYWSGFVILTLITVLVYSIMAS
ncbi:MAG: site-2 protease family protein [Candidatus Nanohalobium sp.]